MGCTPSPRDVVPDSHDVRVIPDGGAGSGAVEETYAYVARRPHGVLALAEARQINPAEARALVDRLADEMERCMAGLERNGALVDGAARVVALADPSGTPLINMKIAPGDAVAQNALICIVAPVRATTLPAATRGTPPGLALEATWRPLGQRTSE